MNINSTQYLRLCQLAQSLGQAAMSIAINAEFCREDDCSLQTKEDRERRLREADERFDDLIEDISWCKQKLLEFNDIFYN